jgi:hypothetical protein
MKWFYESNGQPHGPIPETELLRLRDTDKLSGDSLVWKEGMPDWAPLNSVKALLHPTPGQSLELHPAPESRLPALRREVGGENESLAMKGEPSDTSQSLAEVFPKEVVASDYVLEWERLPHSNPLFAFCATVYETLFSAHRAGRSLAGDGDWKYPLAFLVLSETLGTLLMLLTVSLLPVANSKAAILMRELLGLNSGVGLSALLLSSLFLLPLSMLMKSVVLHACLKFFGRSKAPFAITFRSMCYAVGSCAGLWLIPLVSVAAASFEANPVVVDLVMMFAMLTVLIWSLRVTLRVLAAAHGMSFFRATVATLLPPFLIFTLIVRLYWLRV